ncbi:hypothetical protein ElyMa_006488800 [Elysia marginata]|uniref:Uncharacterized protein n=1 Tax=Elysia marginata TaxID=1093978 RepID=A0AAV4I5A9_9GAST|nr:hypothetical protein ElyMa_006488800 [Elysia marginata]
MAAQHKPLRFLFSKYAALAPTKGSHVEAEQGALQHHNVLRPLKLPGWSKAGSLSDLHLLESDVSQSKLDRIQVFLALSKVPGRSPPSVVNSSTGTSVTASCGQSRGRPRAARGDRVSSSESPTRFRSRSQEFENIYRLAASRCSHELLKNGRLHLGSSAHQLGSSYPTTCTHSPTDKSSNSKRIQINGKNNSQKQNRATLSLTLKRPESANSNDLSIRGEEAAPTRAVMQVKIEEKRNTNTDGYASLRPAHPLNFSYQDLNIMISGNYPVQSQNHRGPSSKLSKRRDEPCAGVSSVEREQRIQARQIPRCPSLSTVDADRLDSSCYHYLLDGYTSSSGSSTLTSDDSEGASSKVSARAQRPSTSGTEATAQRLRNLHTRTTDLSSPPSQTQSVLPQGVPGMFGAPSAPSNSVKSPELPWPPRYALNPPWTSFDDIQAQNGPDFGYCNKRSRRFKDREKYNKTGALWASEFADKGHQNGKVHVVPSHVSTECEQCNLYNSQCAKHQTRKHQALLSSPLSNDIATADGNNVTNSYHKPLHPHQRNKSREDNSICSPSKLYLPPPTAATTNSSLNVNIGIKEPYSASTSRTRATANSVQVHYDKYMPNTRSQPRGTLPLDKPSKTSLFVDNVTNQAYNRHQTSNDPLAKQTASSSSDHRSPQSHPRKPRSGVAYSWERASKVSFVNTTV